MRKGTLAAAVLLLMLSIGGAIVVGFSDSLSGNQASQHGVENDNAFMAYGEVPIPGTQTLHLPAGNVAITFHAVTVGVPEAGLPVPNLKLDIAPPTGVAKPTVTETVGGTTSIDNDARRQVWTAQIPQDGNYQITTEGQVTAFVSARLAFGSADMGSPTKSFGTQTWAKPVAWVVVTLMFIASVGLFRSAGTQDHHPGADAGASKRDVRRENMVRLKIGAGMSPARARAERTTVQVLKLVLIAGAVLAMVGLVGDFVVPSLDQSRLVVIGVALSVGAFALVIAMGVYSLRAIAKVRWLDGTVTIRTVEAGHVGEDGQRVVCEVEVKPHAHLAYEPGPNSTPQIAWVATKAGPMDVQWLVVGATCAAESTAPSFII